MLTFSLQGRYAASIGSVVGVAALSIACGQDAKAPAGPTSGSTVTGSPGAGGSGSGPTGAGGDATSTGGGSTSTGSTSTSTSSTTGSGSGGMGGRRDWDGATVTGMSCDATWAFCDTFEKGPMSGGRAGDLDPALWAAGRVAPQLPTQADRTFWVGPGTMPACRAGSMTTVLPDNDTLICDPTASIRSHHMIAAVAAQNYGLNTYRIRRPFDFAGRTGVIVLDAEAFVKNMLFGWTSIEINQEPTPTPSFIPLEYGPLSKNGVTLQFIRCDPNSAAGVKGRVYSNYVEKEITPSFPPNIDANGACVKTKEGNLNHFEVRLSQTSVEVFASDFSVDGGTFPASHLVYSADLNLPFTRGYVSVTAHNHATLKYSPGYNNGVSIDDWLVRWDNIGFDGPVVSNWREHSFPDSLAVGHQDDGRAGVNLGYRIPDVTKTTPLKLTVSGVDTTGVASAKLTFTSYYLNLDALANFTLKFRVNGGAWHDRPVTAEELVTLRTVSLQGTINQIVDVPVAELKSGDNTFEFQTANVPQNYPPALANMDLVLLTQ